MTRACKDLFHDPPPLGNMQARKQAGAIEISVRMDRLAQQAGDSMVTTNTLASMDEDDDTALKRFNIILKASALLTPAICICCRHDCMLKSGPFLVLSGCPTLVVHIFVPMVLCP